MKIQPYENNAKKHPQSQIKALYKIVKEVGWRQPVLVNQQGVIVAGHGRWETYQQYKKELKEIWVICDMGKTIMGEAETTPMTEAQEATYRLADNRLQETGVDMGLVKIELQKIEDLNFDINLTGYDASVFNTYGKPTEDQKGSLLERFVVPPFSILSTRQGYWTERKEQWRNIIGDNGESRENTLSHEDSLMSGINNGVSILDPVLAELAARWFAPAKAKIFDCFAGDTVFGYVSSYLGNKFTGIELRQEQVDLNNARAGKIGAKYICDDGQNVDKHLKPNSMDMLFSCPPYFDLEVYSDLDNDASNQGEYEDFLKILENAFSKSIKILKDDRFAVIVVGDVRDKKGFYRNFVGDIKNIFIKNDMKLYNELILVEPIGTLPQRVTRSMRNRKVGKCHQNVLVFYKGDPKEIKNNFNQLEYESKNVE